MAKEQSVPYEKLSKRKRKELNARQRRSWGTLNPVTRMPPRSDAYRRNDAKREAGREIRDSK